MTIGTFEQYPPMGVHGKEFNDSSDTLWLWIQPKKLSVAQVFHTRGKNAVSATYAPEPAYKLLMPTTYSTSQNHEWDKFESVGVKFNELATEVSHATHNITSLHKTSAKTDAPLFYKDSARREWIFEFQFIVHTDAYRDVWLPIQRFLQMSAPRSTGELYGAFDVGIEIPYLFGLQTRTGAGANVPVLSVPEVCITSVQPKYEQPYIGGYPSKAELTITFKDMNTLYKDSYRDGSNVEDATVIIKENGS